MLPPAPAEGPHLAPLPPVVGHRGACAHAPENTLAGLSAAAALGVGAVEFDVRLSRDRACVLIHDADLARTTDGSGAVGAHDLAQLKTLDAGAWFNPRFTGERIPTLAEALALCVRLGLRASLDVKSERGEERSVAAAVCAELRALGEGATCVAIVSSLRRVCLQTVRLEMPELPLAVVLRWGMFGRAMSTAHELDCIAVHIRSQRMNARMAATVKAAGLWLGVFTVKDPARAAALMEAGVDYLFSDAPDRIMPTPQVAAGSN